MGESESKPVQQQPYVQNFNGTHQLIHSDYDDPRLGRVQIYQGQEGYVAVKKSFLQGKNDENFSQSSAEKMINTLAQCPYLLRLYSYSEQTQKAMCGSSLEISTYHEVYLNNLEAEISQRIKNQVFYQESELWIILYSIISASSFLENNKRIINDVRSQNVYITENGQIKLLPYGCFPDDMSAYQKAQTYHTQCFLSPEQLEQLNQNVEKPTTNVYKADTFAIGMTLLECATLLFSSQCYNWQTRTLNDEIVQSHLLQASQRYPKFLINLIKMMISTNEVSRPSPKAVLQILQPYEYHILNLQKFSPNYQVIRQSMQNPIQEAQTLQNSDQQQFNHLQSINLGSKSPNRNLQTSYYKPEPQLYRSNNNNQPHFTQQSIQGPLANHSQYQPENSQVRQNNFKPAQFSQGLPQQLQQQPQISQAQSQLPIQQQYQSRYQSQQQYLQPQQYSSPQHIQGPIRSPSPNFIQSQPGYQYLFQPQQQPNFSYDPNSANSSPVKTIPSQQQFAPQPYYQPQQGYQGEEEADDLNDIDKRINEVLNRTKSAMERAGQIQNN